MIKHFRIDERLIHGQVATVWINTLGCDRIIVANDEAPKSEMQIAMLKMACPAGVKLSLLSVEKAVRNINDGKYDSDKVFLIVKDVSDCKRAFGFGLDVGSVNVGNASYKEGYRKIKNSVSLNDDEIGIINDMIASGINVTAQMLPNESGASIATFIK